MKPKWCGCKAQDSEACEKKLIAGPCFCACHKAERRPPVEVRADLIERLQSRATFVPTDISTDPNAFVAFTIKDDKSEILVEYQPGEGFGLTLVGWCEDEDRTYKIDSLVSKINYWLDGNI